MEALPRPGWHGVPAPLPVVVPSRAFSEEIERCLADRFGVCMGFEFLTPQEFVHQAVGPGRGSPWFEDALVWQIYRHVGEFVSDLGLHEPGGRELFAAARALATRFDRYGRYRPDLIRCWAKGSSFVGKNNPSENWQRRLWQRLSESVSEPHPGLVVEHSAADPERLQRLARQFPFVVVLGSGAVEPGLVECLGLLASGGSEVAVHTILPTLDFLGGYRSRKHALRVDAELGELECECPNPLLESMGRQAIGAFALLGELDSDYSGWPEPACVVDPAQVPGKSLLARIQSDIRNLSAPERVEILPGDSSLRVHSCFGPRREVEALRDEILGAFDELPGLRPEDIRILTPDPEAYAPIVAAVLGRGSPPLPVRFADGLIGHAEPLAEAVLALFAFCSAGRFDAPGVLGLLNLPKVQDALGGEEAGDFRELIRASGLTWGTGFDTPGSLGEARDRLTAARWFEPGSRNLYPHGSFVLPCGDELAADAARRRRLIEWLVHFEALFIEWQTPASPAGWARRLTVACENLLGGAGEDGEILRDPLARLASTPCEEELDAASMRDWFSDRLTARPRRAQMTGHIACGRFHQLQNLPCRVLAMLGMHDEAFPSRETSPSGDLLRAAPRVWDRNPRIEDRQRFLDAVLAPSDRLIITATTRNHRTLDSEPFSSCVDELLRVAEISGGQNLVVEHRLQPFSSAYFLAESKVPHSYDTLGASVARRIEREERTAPVPFSTGGLSEVPPRATALTIAGLLNFWKCPARAFVQACGIALPFEEPLDEEFGRAAIHPDPLALWRMKQALLTSNPAEASWLAARFAAERALGVGAIGEKRWRRIIEEATPLATTLRALNPAPRTFEAGTASGFTVTGTLDCLPERNALLVWRAGKASSSKHLLGAWLGAVLASVSGAALPTLLFSEQFPEDPRELPAIETEEAGQMLEDLVEGALSENLVAYAPQTSEAIAKKLAKGADERESLDAARVVWFQEPRNGAAPGEGLDPAARLAWRDRDPFECPEWLLWARRIAEPLRKWIARQ